MIPTRHKARLPKALSWPLGAEAISVALADAPHVADLGLWFSGSPVWPASEFRRLLRESLPYPGLVAEYRPASKPGYVGPTFLVERGGYEAEWLLRVSPVPREVRSVAGGALRETGLPAVAAWLRSSDRPGWEGRYHRLTLVFSRADGALTPQLAEGVEAARRTRRRRRWAVKIDVKDLIGPVRGLQAPGTRAGWPDDPTPVSLRDPRRFATALDAALAAFHDLRPGAPYLVSAEVNSYHRSVWVRFVRPGPSVGRNGRVEPALEPAIRSLRAVAAQNGGGLHYWGGNDYFDLSLPFRGPMREDFPKVEHLPWDERYRRLLERASWESLRRMVFRFSNLGEAFAARCVECRASRVLIPSVGLCVHPWLFADLGLSVVATDAARSALAALAEPARWPRLFSRSAFERWDIAESASYASQGNPDRFAGMPALEDQGVRESLRQRLTFTLADWAELPLACGSVDALFATNARFPDGACRSESPAEGGRGRAGRRPVGGVPHVRAGGPAAPPGAHRPAAEGRFAALRRRNGIPLYEESRGR
jgi:hypothetical protein